jgi:DnaJ-class molecular chaperone
VKSTKNPYEILGVARDADPDAIRKAYRKLARENHPDLHPDDPDAEERFKNVSRAWEVLEDPKKRRDYDEFGDVALDANFDAERARAAQGSFHGFGGVPGADSGGLEDLFGQFFSGGGRGRASRGFRMRGADTEASLELDFEEAIQGGEKRFALGRPTPDGRVENESLTVRIPPGVDTGGTLRIPGKGSAGIGGGPPGDLIVSLRVRPHTVFGRDGRNLTLELPVSIREATLGARVDVPTLDGRATLTAPPGTDRGTRLRRRGMGVPTPRGGTAASLLVRSAIRVPLGLDAEAEAALTSLERFEDPAMRKKLFD